MFKESNNFSELVFDNKKNQSYPGSFDHKKRYNIDFEYYQDTVRIVTFSIVSVVIVITITFILKTYYDQETTVISDLHVEAERIEKLFAMDLEYTKKAVENIKTHVISANGELNDIAEILQYYHINPNIENVFSWLYFAWVDHEMNIVANNISGVLKKPIDLSEMNYANMARISPNKVFYGHDLSYIINKDSLVANMGVVDKNGVYLGSVLASFDIEMIIKLLNDRKKNDYTNFAIIDHRMNSVIKSKDVISKVGIKGQNITSNNLVNILKRLDFYSDDPREFSYLNMFTGLNYYVKKIPGHPFILLVNIDHKEIQGKILHKVIIKFLEISIYASLFLIMVISIYKRETWLRSQAEKSSQIATKATEAKTEFLEYTVHEIRSPLGFILTSSQIMQQKLFGQDLEKYIEYINGINQNSHLILDFINEMLDEKHIVDGNFKIDNKIVNVDFLIKKAINLNLTRFNNRKIQINYSSNANLEKLICDPKRLLQILNNIISNAIKYSNDNTEITIEAKIINKNFEISISDQGIGMSEEDLILAITKYGSLKKNKNSLVESHGIGLSLVKKLVEAHDANLVITSKLTVGTNVRIIFPHYKIILKHNEFTSTTI